MLDHPIVRLATGEIVADARSDVFQDTFDRALLTMLEVAWPLQASELRGGSGR
jgi:hypothetical protein